MRVRFSGFSCRYLVEEKWEQLGGNTASSTLGWRERDRDRAVLSEDESAVSSLSMFHSLTLALLDFLFPCSGHRHANLFLSSLRFDDTVSPLCPSCESLFSQSASHSDWWVQQEHDFSCQTFGYFGYFTVFLSVLFSLLWAREGDAHTVLKKQITIWT